VRALRIALVAAGLASAATALAMSGGKVVNYRGGGAGRVTFDSRTHAKAGYVCKDCHADRFPTRRTGLISMVDHEKGTACFGCHDGKTATAACDGCHRK
jgi:c(7)-type cytochrome triheme protein